MKALKTLGILSTLCLTLAVRAQSVIGTWKTVDDRDKKEKSHVEIYEQNGVVFGKISKLLKDSPDKVCDRCKGSRKDQLLLGMVVMEDLKQSEHYFEDGRVYDPVTGHDYKCSIWLEPGKPNELRVRGTHWSGIYRTQTWHRVL